MKEQPGPILARVADKVGWRQISGPLFRKYVLLFIAVVCVALISNGIFEVAFTYREHKASLIRIQGERARRLQEIDQFIRGDQEPGRLDYATAVVGGHHRTRRFDGLRLLRQVPAITERPSSMHRRTLSVAARHGREWRAKPTTQGPEIHRGRLKKVYYGGLFPPRIRPYMTLAPRHAPRRRSERG